MRFRNRVQLLPHGPSGQGAVSTDKWTHKLCFAHVTALCSQPFSLNPPLHIPTKLPLGSKGWWWVFLELSVVRKSWIPPTNDKTKKTHTHSPLCVSGGACREGHRGPQTAVCHSGYKQ